MLSFKPAKQWCTPLHALAFSLLQAKQLQVAFSPKGLHLAPGSPLGVACLSVTLPTYVWERPSSWRPTPAAILLLNALAPLYGAMESMEGIAVGQQQQQQLDSAFLTPGGIDQDIWALWHGQLQTQEELEALVSGQPATRCGHVPGGVVNAFGEVGLCTIGKCSACSRERECAAGPEVSGAQEWMMCVLVDSVVSAVVKWARLCLLGSCMIGAHRLLIDPFLRHGHDAQD